MLRSDGKFRKESVASAVGGGGGKVSVCWLGNEETKNEETCTQAICFQLNKPTGGEVKMTQRKKEKCQ